jgi:hypothetical protein
MIKNIYCSPCKVPDNLLRFNETWIFSADFSKNTQTLNFLKLLPAEAELFHADGQTDIHDEYNSRFWNFGNAPKNKNIIR